MEAHSLLDQAASFLGLPASASGGSSSRALRERLLAYVEDCEGLLQNPRANRIQLNKARAGLAQVKPWLPAVEIAAALERLEEEASQPADPARAARTAIELRKLGEATQALPTGDDRECFLLRLEQLKGRPLAAVSAVAGAPSVSVNASAASPVASAPAPAAAPVSTPNPGLVTGVPATAVAKPAVAKAPPPTQPLSPTSAPSWPSARPAAKPTSTPEFGGAVPASPLTGNGGKPPPGPPRTPPPFPTPPLPLGPAPAPAPSAVRAPAPPALPAPPPPRIEPIPGRELELGAELDFRLVASGGPVRWEADGLPPGLVLSDGGRLVGAPTRAGEFQVRIRASSDGGSDELRLVMRVRTSVPAPTPTDRLTLLLPSGRRLHVWATPSLRLGRTGESHFAVFAYVPGNPSATKALTGEISRQHAEIWLEPPPGGAFVRDGWRPGKTGSSFGTVLNGRRLGPAGQRLQSGQILGLTERGPTAGLPAWRVQTTEARDLASAPGPLRALTASAGVGAVALCRQDAVPDDLLILRGAFDLATLDGRSGGPWLWREQEGFLLVDAGGRIAPLASLESLWPGARVLAVGKIEASSLREMLTRG